MACLFRLLDVTSLWPKAPCSSKQSSIVKTLRRLSGGNETSPKECESPREELMAVVVPKHPRHAVLRLKRDSVI